jgi:predicted phosphoribosyltransferase
MEANEREKGYQIIAHTQSELLEKAKARTEIRYRTLLKEVEREVEKPVYRVVCLTDDGVRIANNALRGPSSAAGESPDPLP